MTKELIAIVIGHGQRRGGSLSEMLVAGPEGLALCIIPRREVKMLPVTADSIFWVRDMSISPFLWSRDRVSSGILSWRWPSREFGSDEVEASLIE